MEFSLRFISQWVQWVPDATLWLLVQFQNWNRHAQQVAEFSHQFPDLWNEAYYGRKGQVEATRTAST